LETMRQFGQVNLSAANSQAVYRDRHADYYSEFVLSRRPQLQGAGDQAALDQVERELENIRVALRHAADDHRSVRFEAIFSSLYALWLGRNRSAEGAAWAAEIAQRPDVDPGARIVALGFAASVANSSDLALSADLARTAIDLAASTDAALPLIAMAIRSLFDLMQGNTESAIVGCEGVLAMLADEPDLFIRATAMMMSCAVLATCGDVDRTVDLMHDLTELSEHLDNTYLRATSANAMAPIIHRSDPDHAREYLLQAYELNRQIRNHSAMHSTMMFLALYDLRTGDLAAAATAARRSLEVTVESAPAFTPQTMNVVIAIVKRKSPEDAAVLLAALGAHRRRTHHAGTDTEMQAEARYEESLRRRLGDEFETHDSKGAALDEPAMISLAFTQLARIAEG
jgi:hypothetical protein